MEFIWNFSSFSDGTYGQSHGHPPCYTTDLKKEKLFFRNGG